jgi:hypothetical protein
MNMMLDWDQLAFDRSLLALYNTLTSINLLRWLLKETKNFLVSIQSRTRMS